MYAANHALSVSVGFIYIAIVIKGLGSFTKAAYHGGQCNKIRITNIK